MAKVALTLLLTHPFPQASKNAASNSMQTRKKRPLSSDLSAFLAYLLSRVLHDEKLPL